MQSKGEDKIRTCIIKEQTIDFLGKAEGELAFKFVKNGDHPDAHTLIIVTGAILPYGNFDLQFDSEGEFIGGGVNFNSSAEAIKK